MQTLFQYNWQVRNEWLEWCKSVSAEELLKTRTGGIGGILHTLFHIVDVEYSWICYLQDKAEFEEPFEKYNTLEQVIQLSERFHEEVKKFVYSWTDENENRIYPTEMSDGLHSFTGGEILRHTLVHEIHHIGQLLIWARELGSKPISANLIGRGLIKKGC